MGNGVSGNQSSLGRIPTSTFLVLPRCIDSDYHSGDLSWGEKEFVCGGTIINSQCISSPGNVDLPHFGSGSRFLRELVSRGHAGNPKRPLAHAGRFSKFGRFHGRAKDRGSTVRCRTGARVRPSQFLHSFLNLPPSSQRSDTFARDSRQLHSSSHGGLPGWRRETDKLSPSQRSNWPRPFPGTSGDGEFGFVRPTGDVWTRRRNDSGTG
jgi:hypothetical protein